ncbi:HAMP domain-containing sensor histidine kinase [Opitutus sp. ER46]|uniref:sensor histidine kinase n=1 Tax=Opitutus sp. ER46 TaxID=2161864 RepID=UPI000D318F45|nr:HAMP domain-containing sensor histidine kinase [Opitutus sp. ER46]PTX96462.1 sensor histidine kinase [Opitutus sp. ER46]
MSPTSRRIFLYWLLLLVPTLVVAAAAVFWLRREQARIGAQGTYALESRRAAVAARVALVVENAELLVGDVQAGLLDALAAEPADRVDATLDAWEKDNPLVRVGFRATENGRLLRPGANASEEARGFLRRFGPWLREAPPWREADAAAVPPSATAEALAAAVARDKAEREAVTQNTSQIQSARRDVQNLFKSRETVARSKPAAVAPSSSPRKFDAPATAIAGQSRMESDAIAAPVDRTPAADDQAESERRGWTPRVVDGRMHLLGWVKPSAAAEVRGVELQLAALVNRLGAALPAEYADAEGYLLRDEQGRVLHQVGLVPRGGEPTVRLPLARSLLPGWTVEGYLGEAATSAVGDGRAFFWIGLVLVAIFVAAVLGGGSLLVWQARRSEAEAAQKTSFVANVSHEFKTPLTTIRLYAELLEQGRVTDAAKTREYLGTIGRETQRLARLVNNALDFSRLEQGRKRYALESLELGAVLNRLLDTHEPRLAEAGLRLQREFASGPVPVVTDRDAVEQIVLNLLDNAAKYAAAGGEVTVALAPALGRAHGGGASVCVRDRGPGVPPEHRERIFAKFHRVDDTLTAEKGGTGLGLSIARQLARGLGGELRFAPRAGGGAEFILELS